MLIVPSHHILTPTRIQVHDTLKPPA